MSDLPETQRVAAYGLILDGERRILLCRLGPPEPSQGKWTLPGGGLDFGEHPADAVRREVREETGLEVAVGDVVAVDSELFHGLRGKMHAIRVIYQAVVIGGALTPETDGSTDDCRWFSPEETISLPMVPLAQLGIRLANRLSV